MDDTDEINDVGKYSATHLLSRGSTMLEDYSLGKTIRKYSESNEGADTKDSYFLAT